MAVEKAYKCDLCGEFAHRDAMVRFSVRTFSDRPEDADTIDVGPECVSVGKPISDVVQAAKRARAAVENGD